MKITIGIAAFNQLSDTKGVWGCLVANTVDRDQVELVVVDNGSSDGTSEFLERFVFPHFPDHRLIRNPENVGVIPSLQQIYEGSTGEILVLPHNDLYILEHGWNVRVENAFRENPRLGLAGFLGNEGIAANGGRINTYSNLLEAEIHGIREKGVRPVIGFDGLCLMPRRAMLDEIGGFDTAYSYHHWYDRDLSMANYVAGWKAAMIGIYCHHRSGVTANRPEYQQWADKKMGTSNFTGDQAIYEESEKRWKEKWGRRLPVQV